MEANSILTKSDPETFSLDFHGDKLAFPFDAFDFKIIRISHTFSILLLCFIKLLRAGFWCFLSTTKIFLLVLVMCATELVAIQLSHHWHYTKLNFQTCDMYRSMKCQSPFGSVVESCDNSSNSYYTPIQYYVMLKNFFFSLVKC